ncbi:MAG: hypothetical protein AAF662_03955 [Pseudomonadota bacterium]
MSKSKKDPKEFRPDTVSVVLEQGYDRKEAVWSFGIGAQMLSLWIR